MNAPRDPNIITPRGPRGVALPPGNFSPSNFVGDPKSGKFIDFEAHFGHAIVKDEFLAKAEWADRDNPADAHFGGRSAATPMHGKYDDRQPDGTGDGTGRPYEPGIQGDDPFEGSNAASVPQGRSNAQPAGQPFGKMTRALPFANQLAAFYGGDFGRPNADDEPEPVKPITETAHEVEAPKPGQAAKMSQRGGGAGGWIDFEASMAAMMEDAERTIASLSAPAADDGEDAPVARPRAAKPVSKPVAPAAPQGAPLASRPRAVEARASEAVKSHDALSDLDALVKSLEPFAKSAGHKYLSKKANGHGFDYVYAHPKTGEHHTVAVRGNEQGTMETEHGKAYAHAGGGVHMHQNPGWGNDEHVHAMHKDALQDAASDPSAKSREASSAKERTKAHTARLNAETAAIKAKKPKPPSYANTMGASKHAEVFSKRADESRDPNQHRLAMDAHRGAANMHSERAAAARSEDAKRFHEGEAKQHGVRATEHSMESRSVTGDGHEQAVALAAKKLGLTHPADIAAVRATADQMHADGEPVTAKALHAAHAEAAGDGARDAQSHASANIKASSYPGGSAPLHPAEVTARKNAEFREIGPRIEAASTPDEKHSAHKAAANFHAKHGDHEMSAGHWSEAAYAGDDVANAKKTPGGHRYAAQTHEFAAKAHEKIGNGPSAKAHREDAAKHRQKAVDVDIDKSMHIETITDTAGRPLKKGLYAYRLPTEGSTHAVPDDLLYDYLCGFIEQAYEAESTEVQHSKLDAHDQVKTMAQSVMHALVEMIPYNGNLLRACKKFSVTTVTVEKLLVEKGYYKPRADSDFTDDGLGAMGAGLLAREGFAYSHPTTPFLAHDIFAVPGLTVRGPVEQPAGDMVKSEDAQDPHELLAAAHRRAAHAQWGEGLSGVPDRAPIGSCPIHDGRDIHKAQMLNHGMLPCTCNAPG
jgi:hypothetical protein